MFNAPTFLYKNILEEQKKKKGKKIQYTDNDNIKQEDCKRSMLSILQNNND